jgi:hypothetical protein
MSIKVKTVAPPKIPSLVSLREFRVSPTRWQLRFKIYGA